MATRAYILPAIIEFSISWGIKDMTNYFLARYSASFV